MRQSNVDSLKATNFKWKIIITKYFKRNSDSLWEGKNIDMSCFETEGLNSFSIPNDVTLLT